MCSYKIKKWLECKYIKDKLSYSKIANICGVSSSIIQKYIHKFNITPRNEKESHKGKLNGNYLNSDIQNKETLRNEYINNNLSYRDIASKYNVSIRTIARYIKKYNITPKDKSHYNNSLSRKDETNYICPKCGNNKSYGSRMCSSCYLLTLKGTNNPNYKGNCNLKQLIRGYTRNVWRPKVLSKDRYICQNCKKYLPGNLVAHHKKRFSVIFDEILKENKELDSEKDLNELYDIFINDERLVSLENGITLCKDCHKKLHKGKRKDTYDTNFDLYTYEAKIIDVYDCDTVTAEISLGFGITKIEKIRLWGINTAEIRTRDKVEKSVGLESKFFLKELLLNKIVKIHTYKDGKFGRLLADIYLDGILINEFLIESGYGIPYFGGKKEEYV